MEHDHDIVDGYVYVWQQRLRDAAGQSFGRRQVPLSIPSAPSRIAASKLARVFSGYAAEACEEKPESQRLRLAIARGCPEHTPRWPQHSKHKKVSN